MSDFLQRAAHVLAGGTGTFSKHWARYPLPFAPEALVRGDGCYVWDTQGRKFLDTVASLGANLLGYNHPAVQEAILEQLCCGTSFSMLHPLEVEVAELLCDVLPCAEMVRFCRNGTDANNMAVRLARAFTGKQHALFVGYAGGGMDSYGVTTDRHAGILPQLAPYNHQRAWWDLASIPQRALEDLACILVEVPSRPWGEDADQVHETLIMYQNLAHTHGALLILDEVVTFPRYSPAGAQTYYTVTPDLCTVSKALANGLPLAALVGQRRYMERLNQGDIFASWTFAGETTALAATKAVIETLRTGNTFANLQRHGQRVGDGLLALFQEYTLPVTLLGNFARMAVRWQDTVQATAMELRTIWLAEMARRGILMGVGVVFPMPIYTDVDVQNICGAADEVCAVIADALCTNSVQQALSCPVIDDVLAVRL